MDIRDERLRESLRHIAARFVAEESNRTSLITVTNAILSSDGKKVIILLSVLPTEKEKAVLDFLGRKRNELRQKARAEIRGRNIPFFEFAIDGGEKNRQKIDALSRKQ